MAEERLGSTHAEVADAAVGDYAGWTTQPDARKHKETENK
jgi:hypothetical protein